MYISRFNFVLHTIKYQGAKIMLCRFHQIFIKWRQNINWNGRLPNDTCISTLETEEESVKNNVLRPRPNHDDLLIGNFFLVAHPSPLGAQHLGHLSIVQLGVLLGQTFSIFHRKSNETVLGPSQPWETNMIYEYYIHLLMFPSIFKPFKRYLF